MAGGSDASKHEAKRSRYLGRIEGVDKQACINEVLAPAVMHTKRDAGNHSQEKDTAKDGGDDNPISRICQEGYGLHLLPPRPMVGWR